MVSKVFFTKNITNAINVDCLRRTVWLLNGAKLQILCKTLDKVIP